MRKLLFIAGHIAAPIILLGLTALPGEHTLLVTMAAVLSGVCLSMATTAHVLRDSSLGVVTDTMTTGALLFILVTGAFVGAARLVRDAVGGLPPLFLYSLIVFTEGCLAGLTAGACAMRVLKLSGLPPSKPPSR